MTGTSTKRLARAAAVTLLALVGTATPSIADSPPDSTIDFSAGIACAFGLRVEIWGNPHRVSRVFTDKNGNVVRMLTAGKGNTLVFTNLSNGEKLSLRPNGAVEH